jgi:hypothetical protein
VGWSRDSVLCTHVMDESAGSGQEKSASSAGRDGTDSDEVDGRRHGEPTTCGRQIQMGRQDKEIKKKDDSKRKNDRNRRTHVLRKLVEKKLMLPPGVEIDPPRGSATGDKKNLELYIYMGLMTKLD